MSRKRVRAILTVDGVGVVLIERRTAAEQYYVCPGGGIEANETPRESLLRELQEELGITPTTIGEAVILKNGFGEDEVFFRCQASSRPVAFVGWEKNITGRGAYELAYVTSRDDARLDRLRPLAARPLVEAAVEQSSGEKAT